ncbi:SRPBCC family protein [Mesonia mobilis]|uniref:SRPBCC family protein n=1 Tax=Mesonia mobilis TaxID=369791 RepID=A0ABQ3BR71_9FLAO|nr:SRPBCC family protein [Mesonia mobilis]MBQ0739176.1 SRPBCC family protein [Aquimarina celericrescens]GGZ52638.1 hypothetical protein GCM10008088_12820 [Mesonia mobilis]
MKYSTEIIIDKPREEVLEKLDNIHNLKHWQNGLLGAIPISGDTGEEGSKIELHYKMGKREMTMIQTVIKKKLPTEFHATYDTKGIQNTQQNYFQELNAYQTRWIVECEFLFNSFAMKVMGFLMPGAFKKQSLKYMKDFKAFVEDGESVSNE